jgi:selenocysteine-specific elongation factor
MKVTGTVIEGSIKVSDTVEFPQINEQKQIKSIQMFKKSVERANQGDRIGMLFKQLEATKIERGICSTPGTLIQMQRIIVSITKIKFFKQTIKNKQKFHIICGN